MEHESLYTDKLEINNDNLSASYMTQISIENIDKLDINRDKNLISLMHRIKLRATNGYRSLVTPAILGSKIIQFIKEKGYIIEDCKNYEVRISW